MKIIVTTCDTHRHLVCPFAHQWNKYASSLPVTVLYATEPPTDLLHNFTCVSGGAQYGKWSGWFKRYLESIDDEIIMLALEDFWLVKPVDIKRFKAAYTYMVKHPEYHRMELSFIRCDYGEDVHPHVPHKDKGYLFCPSEANWLASTQPSFWRRQFLIDVLRDGEDIWTFENEGSNRLRFSDMKTLAVEPPLIWHDIGVHGGRVYEYDLQHMSTEDRQELKDLGLLPEGAR